MGDRDAQPAPLLLASTLLPLEEIRDRLRLSMASRALLRSMSLPLMEGSDMENPPQSGASGVGKSLVCYYISHTGFFACLKVGLLRYYSF